MKDINIYLIRHGESTANIVPDMIGQAADTQLTQNGADQAAKLGRRLSQITPDFLASSTYQRALDTTRIIGRVARWTKDIEIHTTDALVEYDPGEWRCKKRSEIYKDASNVKALLYLHMGFPFPGGESYHQVERRAATYLEENVIYNKDILELANKRDVNVIFVSHGQTIKALLHYVMGYSHSFLWRIRIGNTSISHLVYNDEGFFLNSINDMAHLTTL